MQFDYGLDERVPLLKSFLFGLQWTAILVSSIIILGKVIGELHFIDAYTRVLYLQKLHFLSAITLFIQILWGHRLPLVPGPAAVLLVGVIASQGFSIDTIYSSVIAGGLLITILSLSGLFRYCERLFTPNVVAVVLLLIAFTLAPTIQSLIMDRESGTDPLYNMAFGVVLVFMMFLLYRVLRGIWQSTLIIWAMVFGSLSYLLVFAAGPVEGFHIGFPWFGGLFEHMNYEASFQPGVLISFIFCSIALSINDLGSIRAVGEMVTSSDLDKRVTRGITLTGFANMVSGFFGVIGPVNYSISPGVIAATRCASRFTLLPAAGITLILAFCPAAIHFMGGIPSVVVGAVLVYVMTSQIAAGLMVAFGEMNEKVFQYDNGLVIGLSVLLGTMVAFLPAQVIGAMPPFLRPVFGNGFVVGVAGGLILEHLVLGRRRKLA